MVKKKSIALLSFFLPILAQSLTQKRKSRVFRLQKPFFHGSLRKNRIWTVGVSFFRMKLEHKKNDAPIVSRHSNG